MGCPDADPDVNVRWVAVILAFISAIVFVVSIIRIYKRTHWNPRKDTNKMVESPNIQGKLEIVDVFDSRCLNVRFKIKMARIRMKNAVLFDCLRKSVFKDHELN